MTKMTARPESHADDAVWLSGHVRKQDPMPWISDPSQLREGRPYNPDDPAPLADASDEEIADFLDAMEFGRDPFDPEEYIPPAERYGYDD